MSLAIIPSRRQCVQSLDAIQGCQCSWFAPTLLDQHICGTCGHGIHTHVDYVSMIVNYYPATQCEAYVQKSPLTQRCTCGIWLSDHVATNNLYRSAEPWDVLDHAPDNDALSSNMIGFSNDAIINAYAPNSMSFSSTDSNTDDAGLTPAPISSLFISPHAFGRSGDATISSARRAPSTNQLNATQTQGYGSGGYFVQYPDRFTSSSYVRQLDGGMVDESAQYQYHSPNTMQGAPEAWSGQYD